MFILTKSNISLWLKQSHHGPNLIVAACTWLQYWEGDFKPVGTQNTPADWGPVLTLPRNSAPSLLYCSGSFLREAVWPQWQCPSFPPHPSISPSFTRFKSSFAKLQSDPTASRHQRTWWLIAVPFDLGQTLLKSPRLFPQTATFCKHHPPINMAHLKLQGFDTRNGKPMKNKKRCIQCLTSHLVARWGSRVAPLLSWALLQNTGYSLEHGSSPLPTLLPSCGLFLESRQPSLSRTNTNFTLPLTPVIFSKFLKSKILKNIQKTQR